MLLEALAQPGLAPCSLADTRAPKPCSDLCQRHVCHLCVVLWPEYFIICQAELQVARTGTVMEMEMVMENWVFFQFLESSSFPGPFPG